MNTKSRFIGLIILLFLLMYVSCSFSGKAGDNSSENVIKEDLFISDSLISYIISCMKADTSSIYYMQADEDETLRLIIGKLIGDEKVYALQVSVEDTLVSFYCLNGTQWKRVGCEKSRIGLPCEYYSEFEDLDGDNRNEIILSTSPNMNGNRWMDVYYCSPHGNSISYAGSFSTDFTVDKVKKTISVDYEGSFYMDRIKTLYQWYGEKLIHIKESVFVASGSMEPQPQFFEYYENTDYNSDTLSLKFRKVFDKKEDRKYWDDFFQ